MLVQLKNENHKEFLNYIQALYDSLPPYGTEDYDDFYLSMSIEHYKTLLKKSIEELGEAYLVVDDNGLVIGFFGSSEMFGIKVFSLGDLLDPCKEVGRYCFESVLEQFPCAHFYYHDEEYFFTRELYEELNIKQVESASICSDEDNKIEYKYLWNIYAVNGGDAMVRNLEKIQYPGYENFNINDVMFKVMSSDELSDFLLHNEGWGNEYPSWTTSSGFGHIAGFHYFNYSQISNEGRCHHVRYLCAIYKEHIVGLISFGMWQEDQNYESISLVEVSHLYRKHGLMKALIANLQEHLNPNIPNVYLTSMTKMGKACNIHQQIMSTIKGKEFIIAEY